MGDAHLVCIIDDNTDYANLLKYTFRKLFPHYCVQCFSTGSSFLEKLPDLKPRLILLDRHMPNLNGHQVLLAIRQHSACPTIPVVMMSVEAIDEEIDKCYLAGANSFIRKANSVEGLKSKVKLLCQYWLENNLSVC